MVGHFSEMKIGFYDFKMDLVIYRDGSFTFGQSKKDKGEGVKKLNSNEILKLTILISVPDAIVTDVQVDKKVIIWKLDNLHWKLFQVCR